MSGVIVKYGDEIVQYTVIIGVMCMVMITILGIASMSIDTHTTYEIDEDGITHVLYDGEPTGECILVMPALKYMIVMECS